MRGGDGAEASRDGTPRPFDNLFSPGGRGARVGRRRGRARQCTLVSRRPGPAEASSTRTSTRSGRLAGRPPRPCRAGANGVFRGRSSSADHWEEIWHGGADVLDRRVVLRRARAHHPRSWLDHRARLSDGQSDRPAGVSRPAVDGRCSGYPWPCAPPGRCRPANGGPSVPRRGWHPTARRAARPPAQCRARADST